MFSSDFHFSPSWTFHTQEKNMPATQMITNRPLLWIYFITGQEWLVNVNGLVNDFVTLPHEYEKIPEKVSIGGERMTPLMLTLNNALHRQGKHIDHIGVYFGSNGPTHEYKNKQFAKVS